APLRLDNTFDFRNVSTGSYLLDIHCATHEFAPLRVDVHDGIKLQDGAVENVATVEVWGTFRGNEWGNKGEAVPVVMHEGGVWVFEGNAAGVKEYFMERGGFSPLSLLKNPMILIAGVSMILVFGMPYLMDNMDPELKAEFQERQKGSAITGGQAANPLQNFDAAAWLAGSKKSEKSENAPRITEEKGITR
ncbi:ER membrane complex subunit 7, partial [Hyphodiscus hymeniophilus]